MATKTARATLDGDGLRLVAATGSGHTIVMDSVDGDAGPRPAELLLVAQAGCTAMDVVTILRKKRQPFTRYEVRVSGEQHDDPHPHVYQRIEIVHVLDGADLDVSAVRRAIELSATRYCTVTAMLSAGPRRSITATSSGAGTAAPMRATMSPSPAPAAIRTAGRRAGWRRCRRLKAPARDDIRDALSVSPAEPSSQQALLGAGSCWPWGSTLVMWAGHTRHWLACGWFAQMMSTAGADLIQREDQER